MQDNDRTYALPIPASIDREEKRRGCFINNFDVTGWGPWDSVSSTPLPWPGEGALEVEPSGIVLRSWLLAVEPKPFSRISSSAKGQWGASISMELRVRGWSRIDRGEYGIIRVRRYTLISTAFYGPHCNLRGTSQRNLQSLHPWSPGVLSCPAPSPGSIRRCNRTQGRKGVPWGAGTCTRTSSGRGPWAAAGRQQGAKALATRCNARPPLIPPPPSPSRVRA